jgi:ubiquinone/menaquinone biosynthesis C-methylase UbiE
MTQQFEALRTMIQNIYDDPQFFEGYSHLRRVEGGLNAAIEWPAFRRLLPPSLTGLRVLDLGCGMGGFARAARELGADEVVGIDVSERMLAEAKARTDDARVRYIHGAIESTRFADASFDLVTSSLVLQYIQDYASVVRHIARVLRPGGRFAFSVEHPIMTCQSQSWATAPDGTRLHWPVDCYRDEGIRKTRWFVDNVIKYHRTIATYVNVLIDAGLNIVRLEEPEPLAEFVQQRPELEAERRRPPFLLLAADRPGV